MPVAIYFAAVSSLISLFDFFLAFLGGSKVKLASLSLFLVRIQSMVGGGEGGAARGRG